MNTANAPTGPRNGGEIQVLTFDLSGETIALDAAVVREVLDVAPETPVPGASAFVSSVINFRGRVIPVVDLRLAFHLPPQPVTRASRFVVIEYEVDGERTFIGVRADRVHEVTTLYPDDAEPLPSVGTRWRSDFVDYLSRRNGDVVVMPALGNIFATMARTVGDAGRPLRV